MEYKFKMTNIISIVLSLVGLFLQLKNEWERREERKDRKQNRNS